MTIVRLALTAALCLFGACVDTAAQDDSDSTSQAVNGAPSEGDAKAAQDDSDSTSQAVNGAPSEGDAAPSDKTGPTVPPKKPQATTSAATTCINLHVNFNGPFIVSA